MVSAGDLREIATEGVLPIVDQDKSKSGRGVDDPVVPVPRRDLAATRHVSRGFSRTRVIEILLP